MKRRIFAMTALLAALILLEMPDCTGGCRQTIAVAASAR
jgi:hypothetical protein